MTKRLTPVLILLAAFGAAWFLGVGEIFSWQGLISRREEVVGWFGTHPASAPLLFILVYIAAAALCLPGVSILSMASGLLFGTLIGAAVTVVGATTGATLLFLVARYAASGWFAGRSVPWLEEWVSRLRTGLERDGFSYVLALRLIPAFPFWLVNLAPALVGMRLAPFVLATGLGVIPGSLVFASIGAGINTVILAGGEPKLTLGLFLPLVGLGLLSLLPVLWRRWKGGDAVSG